jgi:hypothetical protein
MADEEDSEFDGDANNDESLFSFIIVWIIN